MLFVKRFQAVEAGLLSTLAWLPVTLWLIAVTRPLAIAGDGTERWRALAWVSALTILAIAFSLKGSTSKHLPRVIAVIALAAGPALMGWMLASPNLGGPVGLGLSMGLLSIGAISLGPWLPEAGFGPASLKFFCAGLGILAADVWPGPWLDLSVAGGVAGLAIAALPRRIPTPAVGVDDPPGYADILILGLALGGALFALHQPWAAFLTPTRTAEGHYLAGALLSVGLGALLLKRIPMPALLALAAAGAAGILWFTADLPLYLGLWGIMDRGSWPALQLAQLALAVALTAPFAAPLGAALASRVGGHPRGLALAFIPVAAGLVAALSLQPRVGAFAVLATAGALCALLASWRGGPRQHPWLALASAGAVAASVAAPPWSLKLMNGAVYPQLLRREGVRRSLSEARGREARFLVDDGQGSVAVFEGAPASLVIAGAPIASATGQIEDERFAGLLGAALQPALDEVAVLGPGTGAALAALRLAEVDVVAVGASRARIDALEHLAEINDHLLPDPAVLSRDEAIREHLRDHPGRYDLLVIPPWPQWTFEGAFAFTRERWALVAAALRPTGIAVVALPLDSLAPRHLQALLAGLLEAFPRGSVWLPPSGSHDLIFVGQRGEAPFDTLTALATMTRPRLREAFLAAGFATPTDLFGRLLCGPETLASLTEGSAPTRDARPILDVDLPAAAFEAASAHPLTLFQGHLDADLSPLVSQDGLAPDSEAFSQGIERSRGSIQALIGLLGSLGAGAYDQAMEAVLKMGPGSDSEMSTLVAPYLERAKRDMALGMLDQAASQLGFAQVLAPRQAEPWLLTARLHLRQDQRVEAAQAYRSALERDPRSLEALMGLADLATGEGRAAEAIGYLERARAIDPSRATIAHNLGELYRLIGPLSKAKESFEAALLLDSSLAAAHAGLADVLLRERDLGRALNEAQVAVQLKQDPIHYEVLGQVLVELKDYNRARSAFVQCLLRDPDSVPCLGGMGIVYAEDGQLDKARETWQKILDLRPDHPAALENLRRLDQLASQRAGVGGFQIQAMEIPPQGGEPIEDATPGAP